MGFELLETVTNTTSSFLPTVPDPSLRKPLTLTAVAPLFACYYAEAILVQLPRTFIWKLSLLPIIIWSGWHAATCYDLARRTALILGRDHERIQCWNYAFVIAMMYVPLRAIEWTFASRPYRRLRPPESKARHGGDAEDAPLDIRSLLRDAVELTMNQRGFGWSWSRNPFPQGAPRSVTGLFLSMLLKVSIFDIAYYAAQYLCPNANQPGGDTIFDPSLPPLTRFASALCVTLSAGIVTYTAVDTLYLGTAVFACLFLGYSTSEWPPLSDRPWLSTSLADFWGNRWHHFFRRIFTTIGSRPLLPIFGKPGAVMGAFTLSAVIHDWGLHGLGQGTEFSTVGMFFIMMGVGVLLEGACEEWLGMKVGGWKGWVWTTVWVMFWAMWLVDGWARKGLIASDFIPENIRVGKWTVGGVAQLIGKLTALHGTM